MDKPLKIVVAGTRGIPGIQGGVETHCEELYPRLASMGYDITVFRRNCYVNDKKESFKGVKLKNIYAPRKKAFEAIIHTFLAVIAAKRMKADVLHIHAIGPSIIIPFAKFLGLKVVMTHHGPDYDRKKWGRIARTILKTGERWGVKNADKVIVISRVIKNLIKTKYNRSDSSLIFNGVNQPEKSKKTDYIDSLELTQGLYIITVGRLVPEKGFHDLIEAYEKSGISKKGIKLVIAGDSDHPDEYSQSLKAKALQAGAILTGFIKGEPLNQLFTNAALFVLPSYHEGLPIALLEAMSYNLDVLVSDIPANKLEELTTDDLFKTGDTESLAQALNKKIHTSMTSREYNLSSYNWDNIARQTSQVYESIK